MRIEILKRIHRLISDGTCPFNMTQFMNRCGTCGCFAGWICELYGDKEKNFFDREIDYEYSVDAANILGVSEDISDTLFFPPDWIDETFQLRFWASKDNPKLRQEICLEYLQFFIEKYEKEGIEESNRRI